MVKSKTINLILSFLFEGFLEIATTSHAHIENGVESMDISSPENSSLKDEVQHIKTNNFVNIPSSRLHGPTSSTGFSCVISMQDGVVMYTTSSITASLGFPKDMWIGRSFIDFVHPKDHTTFASQVTSGLAVPKFVNGTQEKAQNSNSISTMVCRIRRYRNLAAGFGIKDRVVSFMPYLLKFTFRNINEPDNKTIYLVIQATPFYSAFKVPNETISKPTPFVMRHSANGILEYIDPESVPYLGYLPQDITDKDALQLYHASDLPYLAEVYESIVKDGGLIRSKPYRMLTQNGDYLQLETEWSSFINPWSKKLEFVIGKHFIIEGPLNPDVFQVSDPEKAPKQTEEELTKAQALRESIIKILNEVLTKPAEYAKQMMSKRCHELAVFMETLMEEQPKTDEELRLELQEQDLSCYERDSVMLGGISPHHDCNDSKSSTETPLSYTQLNYNETLQRYFNSHQPYSYEDYNTVASENLLALKDQRPISSISMSPVVQHSVSSPEIDNTSNVMIVDTNSPDYQTTRLTESIICKHNTVMEKELVKIHRETRSNSKGEREKASNETRLKKKEHLARCNASFQPTLIEPPVSDVCQPHGVKRASKPQECEASAHKHHCTAPRQSRRNKQNTAASPAQPTSTLTTTVAGANWQANMNNLNSMNNMSNMNAYILGVGIQPQMSLMPAVPTMQGVYPMYYATPPPPSASIPATSVAPTIETSNSGQTFQTPMPYMMYGQPVYGSPFMYTPNYPQVSYPMQQSLMHQSMHCSNTLMPLGLTNSNYEEACKTSIPMSPSKFSAAWREKRRKESQSKSAKTEKTSGDSSTSALNRSTEAVPGTSTSRDAKSKTTRNSDEVVDRTDGESSYSSFYSSFFKTETGSTEDSGDAKKTGAKPKIIPKPLPVVAAVKAPTKEQVQNVTRRKMEPPWMEQVCVTSELVYKYQIKTKPLEEVLTADKTKITTLEQPSLVNEQLGQLYLDLQLEGVAARLTLEEGITSSSSSGEETSILTTTLQNNTNPPPSRRKREYSKLVMIYEEDAPLPPPQADSMSVMSAPSSTTS